MSHYTAVCLATFTAIAVTWVTCSVAQNLRFEDIIKAMRVLINTQQQEIRRLRQMNQDLSYELSQLRTKP